MDPSVPPAKPPRSTAPTLPAQDVEGPRNLDPDSVSTLPALEEDEGPWLAATDPAYRNDVQGNQRQDSSEPETNLNKPEPELFHLETTGTDHQEAKTRNTHQFQTTATIETQSQDIGTDKEGVSHEIEGKSTLQNGLTNMQESPGGVSNGLAFDTSGSASPFGSQVGNPQNHGQRKISPPQGEKFQFGDFGGNSQSPEGFPSAGIRASSALPGNIPTTTENPTFLGTAPLSRINPASPGGIPPPKGSKSTEGGRTLWQIFWNEEEEEPVVSMTDISNMAEEEINTASPDVRMGQRNGEVVLFEKRVADRDSNGSGRSGARGRQNGQPYTYTDFKDVDDWEFDDDDDTTISMRSSGRGLLRSDSDAELMLGTTSRRGRFTVSLRWCCINARHREFWKQYWWVPLVIVSMVVVYILVMLLIKNTLGS